MQTECAREQDVIDAVLTGRWPERDPEHGDAELRGHIDGCLVCQDVALVFAAMQAERDTAWDEAPVPAASVVWWRAQVRAREEASRTAARPIAVAQAVAVACLIAAAVALVPLALPSLRFAGDLAAIAGAWQTPRSAAISSAFTLSGTALPILLFTFASVLLAPILLYYVLTEE